MTHPGPPLEHRPGFRTENQKLAGTWPGPPADVLTDEVRHVALLTAGQPGKLHRIPDDMIGHGNTPHRFLQRANFLNSQHLFSFRRRSRRCLPDDFKLFVLFRVVDEDLKHEPIQLSFGQRIRPFLLDRILSGEDEKRLRQAMLPPSGRHLVFLHRLEQSGLSLWRSPIHFVRKEHAGKDRPFDKPKLAGTGRPVLLDDFRAGDVTRHEVRRELNSIKRQVQRLGEGSHHERLSETGHTDQQTVSAGKHRDEQFLNDLFLPDDRAGKLCRDFFERLGHFFDRLQIGFTG